MARTKIMPEDQQHNVRRLAGGQKVAPLYALMGLVGDSSTYGFFLIRAEKVPAFLKKYAGYEQKALDDWTEYAEWL